MALNYISPCIHCQSPTSMLSGVCRDCRKAGKALPPNRRQRRKPLNTAYKLVH